MLRIFQSTASFALASPLIYGAQTSMPMEEKRGGGAGGRQTTYYHGTDDRFAYSIMRDGFRLLKENERHGKMLGYGIYLATNMKNAAFWSEHTLIKCRLRPCRIMKVEPTCDQKVLNWLKREFGKELFTRGPNFHKAIPRNKHLTPKELGNLLARLINERTCSDLKMVERWKNVSPLIAQVRRSHFQAIWNRSEKYWDSEEVVVFNPFLAEPISAHKFEFHFADVREPSEWIPVIDKVSPPLSMEELRVFSENAQRELDEWIKENGTEE